MGTDVTVLADGFAATECPRWHNGLLYFSDMHGHGVFTLTEAGELTPIAEVNGPAGLGFLPDGRLLVVSQRDRLVHRVEADGSVVVHADLTVFGGAWINDMWVDANGRAYVGDMGFDIHGFMSGSGAIPCLTNVYVVAPDGTAAIAATEMAFPNGIVVADNGATLIVAESFGFKLTAFDIAADGSLANRRDWAELGFAPDGIGLDTDGNVWVADPGGHRFVRVAPTGKHLEVVAIDRTALSCAIGGTDGNTLFMCTTESTDPHAAPERKSSRIETARLDG